MEIGEFESEELDELITKSQELANKFKDYCIKTNRIFESQFLMTAQGAEIFTLKIIIKNKE